MYKFKFEITVPENEQIKEDYEIIQYLKGYFEKTFNAVIYSNEEKKFLLRDSFQYGLHLYYKNSIVKYGDQYVQSVTFLHNNKLPKTMSEEKSIACRTAEKKVEIDESETIVNGIPDLKKVTVTVPAIYDFDFFDKRTAKLAAEIHHALQLLHKCHIKHEKMTVDVPKFYHHHNDIIVTIGADTGVFNEYGLRIMNNVDLYNACLTTKQFVHICNFLITIANNISNENY